MILSEDTNKCITYCLSDVYLKSKQKKVVDKIFNIEINFYGRTENFTENFLFNAPKIIFKIVVRGVLSLS